MFTPPKSIESHSHRDRNLPLLVPANTKCWEERRVGLGIPGPLCVQREMVELQSFVGARLAIEHLEIVADWFS